MALDIAENDEHYLPVTNGRYFLPSRDCLDKIRPRHFELKKARSPGLILQALGCKAIYLLVCSVTHTNVPYQRTDKMKLA